MKLKNRGRQSIVGLGLLALLMVGFFIVFQNAPVTAPTAQNAQLAATPLQPESPLPTPTEELWTEPPTPTIPPVPTPLPTPVVTRVPLADPPFIPSLPETEAQPYTLVVREQDMLKVLEVNSTHPTDPPVVTERLQMNVHEASSWFLVEGDYRSPWGAPSPRGDAVALVFRDVRDPITLGKGGRPRYRIHVLDLSSGQLSLLVEDGVDPVWSPDASRIAYRSTKTWGLWVVEVATRQVVELFAVEPESEHTADWFSWSPDGKRIALVKTWSGFANSGGIWVVDALPGGQIVQLAPMDMYAAALIWSPFGEQILFRSSRGEGVTSTVPTNLWVVNVGSNKYWQLTQNLSVDGSFWSPDGQWILIAAINVLEGETPPRDLWLLSIDGSILKRVTNDLYSELDAAWLYGNNKIVFHKVNPRANSKDVADIWELDVRTGQIQQVALLDGRYILLQQAKW